METQRERRSSQHETGSNHRPPPDTPRQTSFEVKSQEGQSISNIGRDQIFIQTRSEHEAVGELPRSPFARVIAVLGMILVVGGIATFMASGIWIMAQFDPSNPSDFMSMGPRLFGLPLFAIGFGAAVLGFVFVFTGGIIEAVRRSAQHDRER